MKNKILLFIIPIVFSCFFCVAGKVLVYKDLNITGKIIANVATPVVTNNAVNYDYILKLVGDLYEGTSLSVAVVAKCSGGQIEDYFPVDGEDLAEDMQWGVQWETNTRFITDYIGSNVYDDLTDLIWPKYLDTTQRNWTNAIDYCTNLIYGGFADWRLPNLKELESLVDLSQYNPTLPYAHPFVDVQNDYYWSSSTFSDNTDNAWNLTFLYCLNSQINKTNTCFVWPVRNGVR